MDGCPNPGQMLKVPLWEIFDHLCLQTGIKINRMFNLAGPRRCVLQPHWLSPLKTLTSSAGSVTSEAAKLIFSSPSLYSSSTSSSSQLCECSIFTPSPPPSLPALPSPPPTSLLFIPRHACPSPSLSLSLHPPLGSAHLTVCIHLQRCLCLLRV